MASVEQTLDISAPPEAVWDILADPSFAPKLVPDILTNEVDPPGMATLGQKGHSVAKLAGRRVEFFTEVTEIVPHKKLVLTQRPGGLFKTFSSTITIEPSKKGTRATQKFAYEASMGYLGKALSTLLVNRTIKKNAKAFLTNVKVVAELKEMPKQTAG